MRNAVASEVRRFLTAARRLLRWRASRNSHLPHGRSGGQRALTSGLDARQRLVVFNFLLPQATASPRAQTDPHPMASRFGLRGFALDPLRAALFLAGTAALTMLTGLAMLAYATHNDLKQVANLANVAGLAGVALAVLIASVAVAFILM